MNDVRVLAARRTAVVPRDGAFRRLEAHELAAPVIAAALADAGIAPSEVDAVVLGNALYGGGNPARMAALWAGLPEHLPAMTLDTQCCSGLDAVLQGMAMIRAGMARVVLAGGVESFSRAPIRMRRASAPDEAPEPYRQPPFAPWPPRDPDMLDAAAATAQDFSITREAQELFAAASHSRALDADHSAEIVPINGAARDAFTRGLTPGLMRRLPLLAGDGAHGITAATTAVEADAAAVLVLSAGTGEGINILGGLARGAMPERPALAPIACAREALAALGLRPGDLAVAEVMEAFAAQAMACIGGIGLDPDLVNPGGGALARGHPIGASGAVLAVRLFHELRQRGGTGLATIAGAGGLASALVLSSTQKGIRASP